MIIKSIQQELESAKDPVAKSLHHNAFFRVLAIGFKEGMLMKEHTAKYESKITILKGGVYYIEENKKIELHQYDEYKIPVNILHSVEAFEDSLCLLTQSNEGVLSQEKQS